MWRQGEGELELQYAVYVVYNCEDLVADFTADPGIRPVKNGLQNRLAAACQGKYNKLLKQAEQEKGSVSEETLARALDNIGKAENNRWLTADFGSPRVWCKVWTLRDHGRHWIVATRELPRLILQGRRVTADIPTSNGDSREASPPPRATAQSGKLRRKKGKAEGRRRRSEGHSKSAKHPKEKRVQKRGRKRDAKLESSSSPESSALAALAATYLQEVVIPQIDSDMINSGSVDEEREGNNVHNTRMEDTEAAGEEDVEEGAENDGEDGEESSVTDESGATEESAIEEGIGDGEVRWGEGERIAMAYSAASTNTSFELPWKEGRKEEEEAEGDVVSSGAQLYPSHDTSAVEPNFASLSMLGGVDREEFELSFLEGRCRPAEQCTCNDVCDGLMQCQVHMRSEAPLEMQPSWLVSPAKPRTGSNASSGNTSFTSILSPPFQSPYRSGTYSSLYSGSCSPRAPAVTRSILPEVGMMPPAVSPIAKRPHRPAHTDMSGHARGSPSLSGTREVRMERMKASPTLLLSGPIVTPSPSHCKTTSKLSSASSSSRECSPHLSYLLSNSKPLTDSASPHSSSSGGSGLRMSEKENVANLTPKRSHLPSACPAILKRATPSGDSRLSTAPGRKKAKLS